MADSQYIQWFPGHMTKTRRQMEKDIDLVDAVVSINDEFGVEIPDDEIENLRSVGDVVRYIENNM